MINAAKQCGTNPPGKFKWFSRLDTMLKRYPVSSYKHKECSVICYNGEGAQKREETVIKKHSNALSDELGRPQNLEKSASSLKSLLDDMRREKNALDLIHSKLSYSLGELKARLEKFDNAISFTSSMLMHQIPQGHAKASSFPTHYQQVNPSGGMQQQTNQHQSQTCYQHYPQHEPSCPVDYRNNAITAGTMNQNNDGVYLNL